MGFRNHSSVLLGLLVGLLGGCDREQDGGAQRFRAAHAAPCPLWRDALLDPARLPAACPWPVSGQSASEMPCAIDYYVGDDEQPRATRRLAYNRDGRLERFSDHRDGVVLESRRITYEGKGSELVVHDYAERCDTPTPKHLFSQAYGFDTAWRLSSWQSGGHRAEIRYAHEQGLLSAIATAHYSGLARSRWTRFDRHGHAIAWGVGPTGQDTELTRISRLHHRDGQIAGFANFDADDVPGQRGRYRYADGRLAAITLDTPGVSTQRYTFRYSCERSPACMPGPARRRHTNHATPTLMSLDPTLKHFVPRDCSDHFAHSGRTCGELLRWGAGFSASCCKTSVDEIQILSESPFTRGRVDAMVIKLPDGGEQRSLYCARARATERPPWACRFARAALHSLAGMAAIHVVDKRGQTIMHDKINLGDLARVVR